MGEMAIDGRNHDPLRLRELLGRAESLASQHALSSVVVGMAGLEGDLIFPEIVDYVESALRVDDAIFRLTRERAVLVLADVDRRRAEEIVGRLLSGFCEQYAQTVGPADPPRLLRGDPAAQAPHRQGSPADGLRRGADRELRCKRRASEARSEPQASGVHSGRASRQQAHGLARRPGAGLGAQVAARERAALGVGDAQPGNPPAACAGPSRSPARGRVRRPTRRTNRAAP